jgi:hypothetical protein
MPSLFILKELGTYISSSEDYKIYFINIDTGYTVPTHTNSYLTVYPSYKYDKIS